MNRGGRGPSAQRRRPPATAFAALALIMLLLAGVVPAAATTEAGPPAGLTAHGRTVWHLDALLRDTFGRREFYLNSTDGFPREARDFSRKWNGACCSAYHLFTFANAAGSAFKLYGPTKTPRPSIGGSGGETPLTINGSYIYCGGGRWLFEHYGNGPAGWQISCHK